MITECEICNSIFHTKRRKGFKYIPQVCSEKCFIKFIQKYPQWRKLKDKSKIEIIEVNPKPSPVFRSPMEVLVYEKLRRNFLVTYEKYVFVDSKYTYIPDFYIPDTFIFLEVKGKDWSYSNYSKFKHFADMFPLLLIDKEFCEVIKWL